MSENTISIGPPVGERPQSGDGARRSNHVEAELIEHLGRQLRHLLIVLDQQHKAAVAPAGGFVAHAGNVLFLPRDLLRARQIEIDRRAAAHGGPYANAALRLVDEAMHLGEAEARSLADLLGGEERLEDARLNLVRHADARVGNREPHVVAIETLVPDASAILRRHRNHAAVRHGVAGVHGEVQDHEFKLAGVDLDGPEIVGEVELDVHVSPETAVEQFAHPLELPREVERLRLQLLPARKRQQLFGERGAALRRLLHAVEQPLAPRGIRQPAQHFQTAENNHQKIVEVMRDPARQLADRLDLLRLTQRVLDTGALLDLRQQRRVGLLQRPRALRDQRLQRGRRAVAFLQQRANFILARPRAQRGAHRRRQRDGLQRPLQQQHVAQRGGQALAPLDHLALVVAARQHDEWQIRPRGLSRGPVRQPVRVPAKQPLLRDEHRADAAFQLVAEFGDVLADMDAPAGAAQDFGAGRAVAADRSEDENPQVRLIGLHARRPTWEERCRRDIAAYRRKYR